MHIFWLESFGSVFSLFSIRWKGTSFRFCSASRPGKDLVSSPVGLFCSGVKGRGCTAAVTLCGALPAWVGLLGGQLLLVLCLWQMSPHPGKSSSVLPVPGSPGSSPDSQFLSQVTFCHHVPLTWWCPFTASSFPRGAGFCQRPSLESQGWCYNYHDQNDGKNEYWGASVLWVL